MSLARFHDAQDAIWPVPLDELRAGRKASHWVWFVFPQLASLGRSGTARFYGIADLDEARSYLADPVLRERLIAAADALLAHREGDVGAIMGPVDALKLRSSMTLFDRAADGAIPQFPGVLDVFFGGARCPITEAAA